MKHEVVFEGEETVHYRTTVKMTDKEVNNLKVILRSRIENNEDIQAADFFTQDDIYEGSDISLEDFYCYVDDEDIMEEENV